MKALLADPVWVFGFLSGAILGLMIGAALDEVYAAIPECAPVHRSAAA